MIKKLAVPFLTFTIAAFGCSSSTTPTTGTGGASATGGSSAGGKGGASATGGAGGASAGGKGGASATGGAGGASATGGAGGASASGGAGGSSAGGKGGGGGAGATAGTNGGAGTSGGGGAKADAAVSMADCTTTTAGSTAVLTAAVFCQNLIDFCGHAGTFTLPTAYATESACETTFNQRSASLQACQSYHLCWGVEGLTNTSGPNPPVHCVHASGEALCVPDGSTGN